MKRHLVTLALLPAAIGLYAAGLALPATGLLVLGAALELAFWIRLFRRPDR